MIKWVHLHLSSVNSWPIFILPVASQYYNQRFLLMIHHLPILTYWTSSSLLARRGLNITLVTKQFILLWHPGEGYSFLLIWLSVSEHGVPTWQEVAFFERKYTQCPFDSNVRVGPLHQRSLSPGHSYTRSGQLWACLGLISKTPQFNLGSFPPSPTHSTNKQMPPPLCSLTPGPPPVESLNNPPGWTSS